MYPLSFKKQIAKQICALSELCFQITDIDFTVI